MTVRFRTINMKPNLPRQLKESVAKKRYWIAPYNPTIIGYADKRGNLIPMSIFGGGKPAYKVPPESYITYLEGNWIFRAKNIPFKDYFPLFRWITANKPKWEKNDLSYLVQGLNFINLSIRNELKNWHKYIEPYKHYTSDNGSWLQAAKQIEFKGSIEPIKWILANRPENEKNQMRFLLRCLRLENRSVKENSRNFAISANAYDYIVNKEAARKQLTGAFLSLVGEGKRPEDITVKMMRNRMDIMRFTYLKNEGKYVQDSYLHTIVTVYLRFWQNFVMK